MFRMRHGGTCRPVTRAHARVSPWQMLDDLNPSQREAVTTLRGPLLVLAGAGSGKTRVVTYRIAELIRHGTRADRILAVTFTKKAAGEMQQRAMALLGKRNEQRPEISTFHALCVRILRRHIRRLGYPEKFAIYDRGDQESLARSALREIRVPNEALRPGDLLNQISRWKTASVRPEQAAAIAQTDKEHLAAAAYRRYQQALKLAGAVDFDDLLLCTQELFEGHADARHAEAGRFDHLLIDEYQDTNGPQYAIVRALAADHRNLCVVGDDDQSIYGWRGAEVSHILRFSRDWPEAKVVRLEENYRSMAPILAMANRLIVFNRQRHDKVLRPARQGGEEPRILQLADETVEAKHVVDEIREAVVARRARLKDFAILFRTNEQPRAFEAELRRQRLPYVLLGGMSFYDRKEVRDILAYMKLLANPADEVSLLRIINTPPRGIGAATVEQLLAAAVEQACRQGHRRLPCLGREVSRTIGKRTAGRRGGRTGA
jgi:DNA helicase-2/ATP-dependent DNA helicase PcrA